MYTAAVIEIRAGTRIREYRPVGMAGYYNSVRFSGIGTQLFFYLFHQLYGAAGACGSAEAKMCIRDRCCAAATGARNASGTPGIMPIWPARARSMHRSGHRCTEAGMITAYLCVSLHLISGMS